MIDEGTPAHPSRTPDGTDDAGDDARSDASVDLLWIPLGAGASVVRLSGRVFEALCAALARRPRLDLYHSALVVTVDETTWTIEMGPEFDGHGLDRGVVAIGAVGFNWLRRFKVFRYEVRCWAGGTIPDASYAVGGPIRLSTDGAVARRIVELTPTVPTPTWGRNERRDGEMWNSNSVTSWLLASAGIDVAGIALPPGGRAPGWDAGRAEAARPTRR